MDYEVVIADDRYPHYQEETAVLQPLGARITTINAVDPAALLQACRNADGIILNLAPMPAEVIKHLTRCRVISRYGVGYDNLDIKAATAKGIWVANVPDYCGEDVSDHALALLLGGVREIARRDRDVRAGVWDMKQGAPQWRIRGKTMVLCGYGQISRILHRKLSGLELGRVLVFDPFVDAETIQAAGAEKADWETALREGDFFSIHMPLNDETRGMFNAAAFAMMKPSAIIVNTSRGPIVDEQDLYEALKDQRLKCAALDVFAQEPINADNPLLTLDNVIFSGHTGWYTEESQTELKRKAAENVRDVLSGKPPKYAVNKPVGK